MIGRVLGGIVERVAFGWGGKDYVAEHIGEWADRSTDVTPGGTGAQADDD